MRLSKQLAVILTLFKQGALVIRDALGDLVGTSLPYRADKITEPHRLSQLINKHSVAPLAGTVSISKVKPQNIESLSSNCNNVVVAIDQQNESPLPDSLFIKLPSQSLLTRYFLGVISSWRLETHFFKHVAPHVPLRTPKTYCSYHQGSRFVLIQENLYAETDVQLFNNLDMLKGPSLDLCRRCLDAFAKLHSAHTHLSPQQQQAILPLTLHPFLSPTLRFISQRLNQLALKPCLKKHPTLIPPEIVESYRQTLDHWDDLLEYWFKGPLSLIHGDSHLGNFFVSGDEMGMLDWQAVHWGNGIRDVQYFLIDSLPAEVLAANEQQLLDYYVERRALYGSPIDREESWQQYRSFSYHTLMTIVVSIGFGALNEEQDPLMKEILQRSVAAVQRVDYPGWLTTFIEGQR